MFEDLKEFELSILKSLAHVMLTEAQAYTLKDCIIRSQHLVKVSISSCNGIEDDILERVDEISNVQNIRNVSVTGSNFLKLPLFPASVSNLSALSIKIISHQQIYYWTG